MSDTQSTSDDRRTDTTTDGDAVDSVDALADNIDPSDVWDTDHEDVGVYEYQRHRNGDVTVLLLCSFADGWQAFALDCASDGEVLESEIVGHATEHSRAVGMCEFWVQQNPDGILGGEPDDEGFLAKLGLGGGGS